MAFEFGDRTTNTEFLLRIFTFPGEMEGSLKKYLLLFVCIAAQLNLLQSQKELSPAQLLEELLEDSCHPENATAFYLNIREMQNVTSLDLHPSWEYGRQHL